jgi:hypothetical protein
MKSRLWLVFLAIGISIASYQVLAGNTYGLSLGKCSLFAVHGRSAVLFPEALTIVKTGSVGIYSGSDISGNYRLEDPSGSTQTTTAESASCADAKTAYFSATSVITCTTNLADPYLTGTLYPGVYCHQTFEIAVWDVVILDGQNNTDSTWLFKAGSSGLTGYHSRIKLTNSAIVDNVFWSIGSSITFGYSSTFVGQVFAQASITVNRYGLVGGRLLAEAAVTFESGSLVNYNYTTQVVGEFNISLGTCERFALMAETALTFGSGQTVIKTGDVGIASGTAATGNYTTINGSSYFSSVQTDACAYDIAGTFNAATTAACEYYLSTGDLSGVTLTEGVYCSAPYLFYITKLKYVTFDAQNHTDAIWIMQMMNTLATGADSSMILINGALAKNIFWATVSYVTLGYASFFMGNIISYSYIASANHLTLDGRAFSMNAYISFAGYSEVTLPNGTSEVVYPNRQVFIDACEGFVYLSGTAIGFSDVLTVIKQGSIGTDPGTATTGYYRLLAGSQQSVTTATGQCSDDLAVAHSGII